VGFEDLVDYWTQGRWYAPRGHRSLHHLIGPMVRMVFMFHVYLGSLASPPYILSWFDYYIGWSPHEVSSSPHCFQLHACSFWLLLETAIYVWKKRTLQWPSASPGYCWSYSYKENSAGCAPIRTVQCRVSLKSKNRWVAIILLYFWLITESWIFLHLWHIDNINSLSWRPLLSGPTSALWS
jgi:hypothetical protein